MRSSMIKHQSGRCHPVYVPEYHALTETFARLLRGTIIALKICEKCSFTPCKLRFFANFCLILVPLMTPCKGLSEYPGGFLSGLLFLQQCHGICIGFSQFARHGLMCDLTLADIQAVTQVRVVHECFPVTVSCDRKHEWQCHVVQSKS